MTRAIEDRDAEGRWKNRSGEVNRILNLGCGNEHIEGAINVDVSERVRPDVVHDLNEKPWPFQNSTFDEIVGYDVVEHVADVVAFMEEVHRVAAPEATIRLTVPHFSCANAWRDPTHRHAFAYGSLDFFCEGHELAFYSAAKFSKVTTHIQFRPSLLNKLVWRAANRWPEQYEDRWCWMFPAWFIYYELRAIKGR
jgi:SAM-dependent methyltransferase